MGGNSSKPSDKSSAKIFEKIPQQSQHQRITEITQSKGRSSTTLKVKESYQNGFSAFSHKKSDQRLPNTPLQKGKHENVISPLRQSDSRFVSDTYGPKASSSMWKFSPSKRQNVLPQMTQRVLTSSNMVLCKLPLNSHLNQSEEKSDNPHANSFLSQVKISNPVISEQQNDKDINLSPRETHGDKHPKTAEKVSQYFRVRESYQALSNRKSINGGKVQFNKMSARKVGKVAVHTYKQDPEEEDEDDVPGESMPENFPQNKTHQSTGSVNIKPAAQSRQLNMSSERKPPLDSKLQGAKKTNRNLTMNTSAAAQILFEKKLEKKTQEREKMTKVLSVRQGKVISPSAVDMKRTSIRVVNQSQDASSSVRNFTNESSITLKKLNSLYSRQQQKKFTTSSPKPKQRSEFNSLAQESQIKETAQQVHSSYRPQVGMWKKNQGKAIGTLQMRQTSYQEPQSQQISVLSYFHNKSQTGDSASVHNPRLTEASMPSQHLQEDQLSIGDNSINGNDYKEMTLPAAIVIAILTFNMNDYPKYIRISAAWHCCISSALDDYCNQLENTFIQRYSKYLHFLRSENNATPIYFCKQLGTRLDRILHCEILNESKLINQTFKVGYSFQYLKSNQSVPGKIQAPTQVANRYAGEHRFDVIKKGQRRVTWLHISDDQPPYSQNEIQMSPGDFIEIPICIFNMNGLIDLNNFDWDDPGILPILNNERDPLSYNRDIKIIQKKGDRKTKVHANTNRICEIEDAVVDWIPVGPDIRDQPKLSIPVNIYEYRFKVLSVHFNELDMHFNKIVLQTIRQGAFDSKTLGENILLQVNKVTDSITNEIRKRGVMFDRNNPKEKIQLRMGDILVLYHSKAIPSELQPKYDLPESAYASVQDGASYQSQVSQATNGDFGTNKSSSKQSNFSPKNQSKQ